MDGDGKEGLKGLVQSSHFPRQTHGTRKVKCLSRVPSKKVGTATLGQFLLVSSLLAGM